MSMPAQKIRPAREQYDKMTDNFFKKRLQRKIKPQKEVLMEKTLKKYTEEQMRQEADADKEKQLLQQKEFEAKAQKRKAELNKLQRNAGFMDEWLEKGLKEWRVNILKKKQREKEDEKFKLRQAEMTLTMVKKVKQDAKEETYSEIQAYEKRLSPKKPSVIKQQTEGVLSSDDDMNEPPLTPTKTDSPSKPSGSKSLVPKDSKYRQVQYNKEREQRRRKMLMDQGKMQREFDAKRREEDLVDKMNRLSRQEQELEYESWRTTQCKQVIIENRKLKEARYRKREDLDTEVAMIREEEALTGLKNQLDHCQTIEQERADNYTVARKQYKRNNNQLACQQFLDLIFDLADEAYQHQQTMDNGNIDSRNWREWTQIFIDKMSMNANNPKTYIENTKNDALETTNSRLDFLEMLDYLNSAYQWAKSSNPTDQNSKPINNFELGNAVRTLIELCFPPKQKPDREKLPLDVKLKLSIIGYAFGGKKTQARLLASKYGISLISVDELIQNALKESEPKSTEEDQENNQKKDKNIEEDPKLKALGEEIRQCLIQGNEISDFMCVKLIMHKLEKQYGFIKNTDYYNKTKQRFTHKEIKNEEQPKNEEKQEIKTEKNDQIIKEENQEVPEIRVESDVAQKIKGFIIIDFPSTLNQAKLLEEALSGYISPDDMEIDTKDKLLQESAILAQPTPQPPPPRTLIPSGLDAVLWLKTTKTECIKRAFGLKKDMKNDTTYHVLYNPPPTSSNDIVEKLQPPPDSELLNAMLTDRHISFEMARSALMKWLKLFGDEKRARCLLQEIESPEDNPEKAIEELAAENINVVHNKITEVISKVLEANNEEENKFNKTCTDELDHEEKVLAAKLEYERQFMAYEDQLAKRIHLAEKKKAEEAAELEKAAKEGKKESKKEAKKEAKKQVPPPVAEEKKQEDEKKPEEKLLEPPVLPAILAPQHEEKKEILSVNIEDQFKRIFDNILNFG